MTTMVWGELLGYSDDMKLKIMFAMLAFGEISSEAVKSFGRRGGLLNKEF
jgi:hypothetical protein